MPRVTQDFRNISVATQITHDVGLAPVQPAADGTQDSSMRGSHSASELRRRNICRIIQSIKKIIVKLPRANFESCPSTCEAHTSPYHILVCIINDIKMHVIQDGLLVAAK